MIQELSAQQMAAVDQTGVPKEVRTEGYPITDRPLVAIVNRATASAAEILVGALKDNHRAALVGTKTFGQDLIHSLQPLTDGSGLVIAVARFKTPAVRMLGAEESHRITRWNVPKPSW